MLPYPAGGSNLSSGPRAYMAPSHHLPDLLQKLCPCMSVHHSMLRRSEESFQHTLLSYVGTQGIELGPSGLVAKP